MFIEVRKSDGTIEHQWKFRIFLNDVDVTNIIFVRFDLSTIDKLDDVLVVEDKSAAVWLLHDLYNEVALLNKNVSEFAENKYEDGFVPMIMDIMRFTISSELRF